MKSSPQKGESRHESTMGSGGEICRAFLGGHLLVSFIGIRYYISHYHQPFLKAGCLPSQKPESQTTTLGAFSDLTVGFFSDRKWRWESPKLTAFASSSPQGHRWRTWTSDRNLRFGCVGARRRRWCFGELTNCTWKWMVGRRSFPFGARPISGANC